MTFFPSIDFVGFIFFSDETLRHCQLFQRIGESQCQNNSLGLSGLWVTLKEFSPISHPGLEYNEGNSPYHKGIKTTSFLADKCF